MSSIEISNTIADIKKQFIALINKYNDINNLLDLLNEKKTNLNDVYKDIEKSHHENNFLFGLDTFSFQNKLIDTEYNGLKSYSNLINNRIYYDYYKLIIMIKKDLNKNNIEINSDLSNTIIKYNYLNIYKKYDLKTIERIFNKIIKLIIDIHDHLLRQENELDNFTIKMNDGLDLNNFCSFYNYKNKVVKENITLYTNYMLFFVKLHNKYISKLDMKTRLMYMQINNEIKTDKYNTNKKDNMKTMMTYLSDSSSSDKSGIVSDMILSITKESPIISSLENQPKILLNKTDSKIESDILKLPPSSISKEVIEPVKNIIPVITKKLPNPNPNPNPKPKPKPKPKPNKKRR